jgi:ferric-dicitrate binding protein FerR (iron transport regulator)
MSAFGAFHAGRLAGACPEADMACVRDRSPKGRDAPSLYAARLGREATRARRASARDALTRLSWQEHMLSFDGETLNEAIAEVSRQTGWRFELADAELGEMRVGGYVAADPEAFIELVSSSLGLEARREGGRRVVLSRRT